MSRRSIDNEAVARRLRALAETEACVETPPHVEAAVMASWDTVHAEHTSPSSFRTRAFVRGAAMAAAGVTIVGAVTLQREVASGPIELPKRPAVSFGTSGAAPRTRAAVGGPIGRHTPTSPDEANADIERSTFVLVGAPIASGELVHIVRMRVDRSALTALGGAETVAADMVDIDVLVGEDGVARGVRVPL